MCSLNKKIFHYPCISAKLEAEEIKVTGPLHLRIPGEEESIVISLKFSNGDRLKIRPGDSIYNSDSQYLYIDKEKNYLVKKNLKVRNKLEYEIKYVRRELIKIKYSDLIKKKKIKKFSEISNVMKEYIKIKEEYDEWFRHHGTASANTTYSENKIIDDDLKTIKTDNEKSLKKTVNDLVEKQQELAGNKANENKEMEQLKTDGRVRTKKVKELITTNRQLRMQINYLKKYKAGNLTDKEIEKIVDSNRMKNGKINYTAVGRVLSISKDTVRKLIDKRRLNWLIEKPDGYTPK